MNASREIPGLRVNSAITLNIGRSSQGYPCLMLLPARRIEEGWKLAAAIHRERRARDKAGERRGQEDAGVADVARIGHASERDRRGNPLDAFLVAVMQMRLLGAYEPG